MFYLTHSGCSAVWFYGDTVAAVGSLLLVFFETQWLQCSLVYGDTAAAVGSLLLGFFETQRLQCSLVYGGDAAAVGSLLLVVGVLYSPQWL